MLPMSLTLFPANRSGEIGWGQFLLASFFQPMGAEDWEGGREITGSLPFPPEHRGTLSSLEFKTAVTACLRVPAGGPASWIQWFGGPDLGHKRYLVHPDLANSLPVCQSEQCK